MTGLTPTFAALFGSMVTAIAIFGGGLAVEAYKQRRDRVGMALALAGAIDALLSLIRMRGMTEELSESLEALDAGRSVEFASLISENTPFGEITNSYLDQIGNLGGDLPFRVARFLTYSQGLQQDLLRLDQNKDQPAIQALLIRRMQPMWLETGELGMSLVKDLQRVVARRKPIR